MTNLTLPPNPTSFSKTGWQIFLMLLMGFNYLLDDDPRHVQHGKALRAKRQAEQARCKAGFVTELPDQESSDQKRPCSARDPPPVLRCGKEIWPYPRDGFRSAEKDGETRGPRRGTQTQMRDAWSRLRGAKRSPPREDAEVVTRDRKVSFDREVRWIVYDDEGGDATDGQR